ncbi:hypothetical protein KFE25_008453 [Diacronema lutheri]|uniref:Guanine nucleotide-binding protein subunit beta-like protein n=1 Tax=Diacronema lutheri TaxID=2081491 RepID=A0A8J5X569_DIALT|nr:hypothetical protein KFE25_008453 [Diacronema lutheri]
MRHFSLSASAELRGHKADVRALCSHGSHLVSTGYDGLINLWDVGRPDAPVSTLGDGSLGRMLCVCDVANRKLFASAGLDGVIRLWDAHSGACAAKLEGHVSSVSSLLARAQTHELFSGGGDEHVLIWDLRSNQGMSSLRGHATSTRALAFGAGDEMLYTGGGDGQVRAWNCKRDTRASVQTYNAVEVLRGPLFAVSALAHDGALSLLASAGMDNVLYCWDLATHSQFTAEGRIRMAAKALRGHSGVVNAVLAWGERGLVSASADGTLRVWDTSMADQDLAPFSTFRVSDGALAHGVRALHALDATRLCTGSSDGGIKVWQSTDKT